MAKQFGKDTKVYIFDGGKHQPIDANLTEWVDIDGFGDGANVKPLGELVTVELKFSSQEDLYNQAIEAARQRWPVTNDTWISLFTPPHPLEPKPPKEYPPEMNVKTTEFNLEKLTDYYAGGYSAETNQLMLAQIEIQGNDWWVKNST